MIMLPQFIMILERPIRWGLSRQDSIFTAFDYKITLKQVFVYKITFGNCVQKPVLCMCFFYNIITIIFVIHYIDILYIFNFATIQGQFIYATVVVEPLDFESNKITVLAKSELSHFLSHLTQGKVRIINSFGFWLSLIKSFLSQSSGSKLCLFSFSNFGLT